MTAPDDFLAALGREAMLQAYEPEPVSLESPDLFTNPPSAATYAAAHREERCRCKGQPLYRLARPDGGHWTWHSMGCPQREE